MSRDRDTQLFLVFGILPGLIVAAGALLVVPPFQSVFADFGAPLPLQTRLLLATYHWWGMIVFVTLGLWALWPRPSSRGIAALTFGLASAMLLFLFGLWAVYSPIVALAASKG